MAINSLRGHLKMLIMYLKKLPLLYLKLLQNLSYRLFKSWRQMWYKKYTGTINEYNWIVVRNGASLYDEGCFGKGSLSRARPTWFQRHYKNYTPKSLAELRNQKVFKPQEYDWYEECIDREEYILMPEEAFYLFLQNRLTIEVSGNIINDESKLWDLFQCKYSRQDSKKDWSMRYAVYHYYKSKHWIVRSGLQFGGDFVLYKQSPDTSHSNYLVSIVDINENVTALDFAARARCSHHVKKVLDF